ncbi:MAG: MBL fold metallo-hydrolase [Thiohalomonadaceae bacterium]
MQYQIIPVTDFEQNCSLVWDEQSMQGAFVDPGGESAILLAAAAEAGVTITRLLLTHGHIDHVGAAAQLAQQLGVPVEGPHEDDRYWLEQLPQQAARFGLSHVDAFLPHRWLADGDTVEIGRLRLQVIHCPGHTPGHIVFYHAATQLALVGDVLFRGAIGRTDFPGGDHASLLKSIHTKLLPLGDEVRFIPGHGPISTFGYERLNNPFLRDK